MEICAESPTTYVDYACTPQAIQRCIKNLKYMYRDRPLAVVFGCGGDRDNGKRALMGDAATAADIVVVTNDNPRSEDPQRIVDDILSGRLAQHGACQVIFDRAQAIDTARLAVGHRALWRC